MVTSEPPAKMARISSRKRPIADAERIQGRTMPIEAVLASEKQWMNRFDEAIAAKGPKRVRLLMKLRQAIGDRVQQLE